MSEADGIRERKPLTEHLLSTIGLCARARRMIFGVPMVCDAMRMGGANKPAGVLESADISENSHKRIHDKCQYYGVELVRLPMSGAELAAAVGKSGILGAVGITDEGLYRTILSKLSKINEK